MTLFQPDSNYPIDPATVPATWALTNLGDVIHAARQGIGTSRHNKAGLGVPHLRPMNISRLGKIVLHDVKYVERSGFPTLIPGDVLFNNTNSADLVGKTAVIDQAGEYYFSNHMTRLRFPPDVSPHFIGYQFLHLFFEGYFYTRRTQHVNQASINLRTLTDTVPLLLAPKGEQLRIVAKLDGMFSSLERAEGMIEQAQAKLNKYAEMVYHASANGSLETVNAEISEEEHPLFENVRELPELLSNEDDLPTASSPSPPTGIDLLDAIVSGDKDMHETVEQSFSLLPSGWSWSRMDKVGSINLGRQRAPQHHEGNNMRPYLRVANVLEGHIDTSDVHEMNFTPDEFEIYKLEPLDILLNEGQSPELVGRPAMFNGEIEGACFQNTLIRFRANHGVSPGFALLVFRSYFHSGRFRSIARWTTNIAHLGLRRFAELEFPLPPLREQERIVLEADRRLELVRVLKEKLTSILRRIHDLRRFALRKAFSGRLVPIEMNEGTAEQLLHVIRKYNNENTIPKSQTRNNNMTPNKNEFKATSGRIPLLDALRQSNSPMTPEELLKGSGIREDNIDEFYSELKRAHDLGKVIQDRDEQGRIYLRLKEA